MRLGYVGIVVLLLACGSTPEPEPVIDVRAIGAEVRELATTRIDCRGELVCALGAEGELRCWGGDRGSLRGPTPGPFVHVAVSDRHACALTDGGEVRCVGEEAGTVPEGRYLTIAGRGLVTCGLRDDLSVVCWGPHAGSLLHPPPGRFRALDFTSDEACAVGLDGSRACWAFFSAAEPMSETSSSADLETIVTCGHGACGRRVDGSVSCSGGPYQGQTHAPEGSFTAIAAGAMHSCAIRDDGNVLCWGANDAGQLTAPAGRFRAIAAAGASTCAIASDETLTCWGEAPPPEPPVPGRARAIAMARGLACSLDAVGEVRCFGADATNVHDLLQIRGARAVYVEPEAIDVVHANGSVSSYRRQHVGSGTVTGTSWATYPAIAVAPGLAARPGPDAQAVVGEKGVCRISQEAELWCRGENGFGQSTPPAGRYRSVALGRHHACGLLQEGRVECWGSYGAGVPL